MTEEMIAFRKLLDEKRIEWEDLSTQQWEICPIDRTHFNHRGYKWSVINGYGTYGGVNVITRKNEGLLELMSEAVNGGEPLGFLTAKEAMCMVLGESEVCDE